MLRSQERQCLSAQLTQQPINKNRQQIQEDGLNQQKLRGQSIQPPPPQWVVPSSRALMWLHQPLRGLPCPIGTVMLVAVTMATLCATFLSQINRSFHENKKAPCQINARCVQID